MDIDVTAIGGGLGSTVRFHLTLRIINFGGRVKREKKQFHFEVDMAEQLDN